jgi:hypothetical protein
MGAYCYPYKCPHCGGCVETEKKLLTHMERSHTAEQSSYQTKVLPSSSKTVKKNELLPSVELVKPIKIETEDNKDSSCCHDSFIITLNASDGNDADDKHIHLVSVDKIKTEVGVVDSYEDETGARNMYSSDTGALPLLTTSFPAVNVKSCPSSEMSPANRVLTWRVNTAAKEVSGAHEEQSVAEVKGFKEKYCKKKQNVDIIIEHVEKSVDSGSAVPGDKPDISIQRVKPVLFTARRQLGAVNSEQTVDVSSCTMLKPSDHVGTETNSKQDTYSHNHLFSSDLSSGEQLEDIDVKPDIIESDTMSYLNMHHAKQYSSIYSDNSYKGRFYRKVNSEADCDASCLGVRVSKQFGGCKNMECQLVNDNCGIASRSVLKTYSRRMFRSHSNTTPARFSSKSVKEVTVLKKEESDSTAGQLNE